MGALPQRILDHAGTLFDVAAVRELANGYRLLLLGMESTPERNLDEFARDEYGRFSFLGFRKHVQPNLSNLIDFIRGSGCTAGPVGLYGYPPAGELNLKLEAVRAGLGRRGKHTVVISPRYGTRLRFIAVVTNARLRQTGKSMTRDVENPLCRNCSICINACPAGVLEPYRMTDPSRCLSDTDNMEFKDGRLVPCDICLKVCPAGR